MYFPHVPGICPPGQEFTHGRICSACAENMYNNDNGTTCYPCVSGFDTLGLTGATQCTSK